MQSQSSGTRTKFRPRTVLVVDDHVDNRDLFATVLRDADMVVTTAADGIEAVETAARELPDVILMDLAMPRMDGFDAITQLRLAEHGREVYIIVVSAFCEGTSRARAEKAGADAFLAKPCDPRALVAAVNAAFAEMDAPKVAAG